MTQDCLAWLNEFGIIVAAIGGIILVIWPLPRSTLQGPHAAWDSPERRAAEREAEKERRSYKRRARAGFGMIIAGFAMQAFANWPTFK